MASADLVEAIHIVQSATGATLPDARMAVMALAAVLPDDERVRDGIQRSFTLRERDTSRPRAATYITLVTVLVALVALAGIAAILLQGRIGPG